MLRSYSFLLLAVFEMAVTVLLCRMLPYSIGGVLIRCLLCLVVPNTINFVVFRKTDAFARMLTYLMKVLHIVRGQDEPDEAAS